ncbi:hypothetical protein [Streptomyces sp. DT203]|uniref:hypothetical protein n=1 Tax=Streptomyces sp. DT203 TaxID=3393424 RepID=UPI003CE8F96B
MGIAGSAPAAERLQQRFEQHGDAFEIHRFGDEAATRTAIEDRVVYGPVVITPKRPQLPTASAASPMVAQPLREAVTTQALAGSQVQAHGCGGGARRGSARQHARREHPAAGDRGCRRRVALRVTALRRHRARQRRVAR